MKKLLLATSLLCAAQCYAGDPGDVIEINAHMNDTECVYNKPCKLTAQYDVKIENHSTVGHYYKILYQFWYNNMRNYDGAIDEVHVEGGQTWTTHRDLTVTRCFDRYLPEMAHFDAIVTGNDYKNVSKDGNVTLHK